MNRIMGSVFGLSLIAATLMIPIAASFFPDGVERIRGLVTTIASSEAGPTGVNDTTAGGDAPRANETRVDTTEVGTPAPATRDTAHWHTDVANATVEKNDDGGDLRGPITGADVDEDRGAGDAPGPVDEPSAEPTGVADSAPERSAREHTRLMRERNLETFRIARGGRR